MDQKEVGQIDCGRVAGHDNTDRPTREEEFQLSARTCQPCSVGAEQMTRADVILDPGNTTWKQNRSASVVTVPPVPQTILPKVLDSLQSSG